VEKVRDDERVAMAVEPVEVALVEIEPLEVEPLEVEPLEVVFRRVETALELDRSAFEIVLEEYTLAGVW